MGKLALLGALGAGGLAVLCAGCAAAIIAGGMASNDNKAANARRQGLYDSYVENGMALDRAEKAPCTDPAADAVLREVIAKARAENQRLFNEGTPLQMNEFSREMSAALDDARACRAARPPLAPASAATAVAIPQVLEEDPLLGAGQDAGAGPTDAASDAW